MIGSTAPESSACVVPIAGGLEPDGVCENDRSARPPRDRAGFPGAPSAVTHGQRPLPVARHHPTAAVRRRPQASRDFAVITTRTRFFLVLLVLSVLGFGPVSLTALIGVVVVLKRPDWFLRAVFDIYRDSHQTLPVNTTDRPQSAARWGIRIRTVITLAGLMILDIAPVPIVGAIGLWIVTFRPAWFLLLVARIYGVV